MIIVFLRSSISQDCQQQSLAACLGGGSVLRICEYSKRSRNGYDILDLIASLNCLGLDVFYFSMLEYAR